MFLFGGGGGPYGAALIVTVILALLPTLLSFWLPF